MISREQSFDSDIPKGLNSGLFEKAAALRAQRRALEGYEKKATSQGLTERSGRPLNGLATVIMSVTDWERMCNENLETRQLFIGKIQRLVRKGTRDVDCVLELTLEVRQWLREIDIPFAYPVEDPGEDELESLTEL